MAPLHKQLEAETGLEVMFRCDAKEYYKLSEHELAALPYQVLSPSLVSSGPPHMQMRDRTVVVPLQAVIALVQRRHVLTGVAMPEHEPLCTLECTGPGKVQPCMQRHNLV